MLQVKPNCYECHVRLALLVEAVRCWTRRGSGDSSVPTSFDMDKVQAMISSVLHGNICLLTGRGGPAPEADVVRHGQGADQSENGSIVISVVRHGQGAGHDQLSSPWWYLFVDRAGRTHTWSRRRSTWTRWRPPSNSCTGTGAKRARKRGMPATCLSCRPWRNASLQTRSECCDYSAIDNLKKTVFIAFQATSRKLPLNCPPLWFLCVIFRWKK